MSKPWPTVRLGEVLTHDQQYIEQPEFRLYPKLSVKLYGKGVVLDSPAEGGALKMQRHQLARPGQVILSEIWGKKGAIGFVPPEGAGALCTSHFFLFDVCEDKLDPRWLQALFTANYLQSQLDAEAKGTTGYAAVRPKILLACEIPLPPLAEQRRAVARITELDSRICKVQALRAESKDETLGLWRSMVANTFRPQPRIRRRLGDVCAAIIDNLHSTPRYDGDDYACIRSQDVGWGSINYLTALRTGATEFAERTRRGQPEHGDIVFVREGDVGRCAVVDGTVPFSLGQRVMIFRPSDAMDSHFLMYQLMSAPVLQDQILRGKTGTTSHHVNIKHLRAVEVNAPSLLTQRQAVDRLERLRAKLDVASKLQVETATELDALLPAILDRAFSGEL